MKTLCVSAREWLLRSPSGQETVLRLEVGQSVTVGRDLTSDVPILDAGVSRHHATMGLERDESGEEALWIEDLHSHNGTFVNTERVHRGKIQAGDVITFGRMPLTLTGRHIAEEGQDPLRRLPAESLALLVRVAREFSTETEQGLIFQKLLELAQEALRAERGVVLLWEERRGVSHPVAASPPAFLQDISRLITRKVGETILRSGKARLLWPELSPVGVRLLLSQSSLTPAPSAIATPLQAGTRPLGILYLDRPKSQEAFQVSDVEFLWALAWVTSSALGTSSQISDMRDWNRRLESLVAQRESRQDWDALHPGSTTATGETPAVLVQEIERLLRESVQSLGDMDPSEKTVDFLESTLRGAYLRARVVRRLCDRRSARLEEVQVEHVVRESSSRRADAVTCTLQEGGDLSVVCAPDELSLALELALDVLAGNPPVKAAWEVTGTATVGDDGSSVRLRLARTPIPEATPPSEEDRSRRATAARLLKSLSLARLGAEVEVGTGGLWVELRLPRASVSVRETAVFPSSALGGRALPAQNIEGMLGRGR